MDIPIKTKSLFLERVTAAGFQDVVITQIQKLDNGLYRIKVDLDRFLGSIEFKQLDRLSFLLHTKDIRIESIGNESDLDQWVEHSLEIENAGEPLGSIE